MQSALVLPDLHHMPHAGWQARWAREQRGSSCGGSSSSGSAAATHPWAGSPLSAPRSQSGTTRRGSLRGRHMGGRAASRWVGAQLAPWRRPTQHTAHTPASVRVRTHPKTACPPSRAAPTHPGSRKQSSPQTKCAGSGSTWARWGPPSPALAAVGQGAGGAVGSGRLGAAASRRDGCVHQRVSSGPQHSNRPTAQQHRSAPCSCLGLRSATTAST